MWRRPSEIAVPTGKGSSTAGPLDGLASGRADRSITAGQVVREGGTVRASLERFATEVSCTTVLLDDQRPTSTGSA